MRTSWPRGWGILLLVMTLLVAPAGVAIYRASEADYEWTRLAPNDAHRIRMIHQFRSASDSVWVQTYLPQNESGQVFGNRWTDTDLANFYECEVGGNRVVEWHGEDVEYGKIETSFTVGAERIRYAIDPGIPLPGSPMGQDLPFLMSTNTVQSDHPAVVALAEELAIARLPAVDALRTIFDYCAAIRPDDSAPPRDALGTLEQGAAGSLGVSRLFMALARHVGLPSRRVTGLVVTPGDIMDSGQDRPPVFWVEVMVGSQWIPFSPTSGLFAANDGCHVPFYRGEEELVTCSPLTMVATRLSSEPTFAVQGRLVDTKEKGRHAMLGAWGTLEAAGISMDVLRIILMFPLGALVSVLLRNVVGIRTFGFFLPMLVSIAALRTGLAWGIFAFLTVIVLVSILRTFLDRLSLLHLPQLAVLLTGVLVGVLGLALAGAASGNVRLTHVTFLPLAVLTITAERLSFMMEEEGLADVAKVTAMSLLSIVVSYLVMSNWMLQTMMLTFPELILGVVFVDILVGQWVGIQLLEYWRFRRLFRPEGVTHHVWDGAITADRHVETVEETVEIGLGPRDERAQSALHRGL